MKKFLLLLGMVLAVCSIIAQAPQAFKYQAIARDEAGNILSVWDISLRISIIEESGDTQAEYMETHKMQTNIYGLINLIIGEGDVVKGDFSSIKWGENRHYLKIEMDTDGGEKYKDVGTTQLYSVPYALYAEQAGKIAGNESSTPTSQPQTVRSTSSANNSWGGRNGTPNSRLPADGDSYLNVITGSVGIGTTLPGGDLEVYKPTGQLNVVLNRATNSSAALLDFQTAGSSEWNISTPPGGDDFYIDRSSGSGDLILAYSGGNVGIGNVGAFYPLDVTGIVNASNYYKNGSEFNEGKWSANGNFIYYNSGNVGIGTSTAAYDLDVIDNGSSWIRARSLTGYAGLIIDKGDESENAYIQYRTANATHWYVGMIKDNNFSISKNYTSSDGTFYISSAQNIGIGTTNPSEKFHIHGGYASIYTTGGSNPTSARFVSSGSDVVLYLYDQNDDIKVKIHSDGPTYFNGGNVGIGDASPEAKLKVSASTSRSGYFTNNYAGGIPGATVYAVNSSTGAGITGYFKANGTDAAFIIDQNGSGPMFKGFGSNGGEDEVRIDTDGTMHFYNAAHTETIKFDPEEGSAPDGSQITLYNGSGVATIEIDGDFAGDGRITTQELQITGGSDIAEPFDVISQNEINPGMVVSIDKNFTGKLKISDLEYDRCVAGIISGAGNVKTGLFLHDKNTIADGEYLVALTGRVYCLADATYGPIEPGDLLTTSNSPGYAMKVTDYEKAQGAILGKAMSGLEEGKGLVFVLVTLQ